MLSFQKNVCLQCLSKFSISTITFAICSQHRNEEHIKHSENGICVLSRFVFISIVSNVL